MCDSCRKFHKGSHGLMGSAEIADLLKVSKQRVSHLIWHNENFPRPLTVLKAGPVFCATDIHEFLRTWTRKPGPRPKK